MKDVVGRFLERRSLLDPTRIALICESERLTYAQFHDLVARTAAMLNTRGIGRGDRVAVLMKNGIGFCAIYHAVARLGAVLCTINWRLSEGEIAFILGHSESGLLIHDREFDSIVSALPALPTLRDRISVGAGEFVALSAHHDRHAEPCPAAPEDPLLLVYTSGTTGPPKGAVLTQAQMFWSSATMACTIDYRREDIGLIPVPLFHVGGLSFATLFVHIGATAVLMPAWDPDAALRLIESERINHFFAVAAMLESLVQASGYGSATLDSLRWIMAGGAPVPTALIRQLAERSIPVIQTYGATETAGPAVVVDVANAVTKAGAAGLPFFHTDLRIVDGDGREQTVGEPGEIQIRAPHLFRGYWRDDKATDQAFDGDWYRSGDIGRLDEEGYLYILDRKKDMIVSGGENIYPAEVERVLATYPQVAEVAVVGVPDSQWGEAVCAVVVPARGAAPSLEDLRRHCAGELAKFKQPRRLVLRETPLPRNATGKLLKGEIRKMIEA